MKVACCLIMIMPLLAIGPVRAGEETIEVTIDVLQPTDEPGEMAPGLRYLEKTMRRSPLKYQNYLELATAFRAIPLGKEETISFQLRRHLKLVIIPKNFNARTVQFSLKLWADSRLILDTELSLVRKGTVMIGAPGNPNLIIALSEGF
ncbi:MAG: hypothetical protein V1789_05380 [PVC group bacterium]